ncbi:FAD-dependent oxidoreductase [Brachybacterium timonense]|uniref:FAD-dependent oxidoreductase n=1 Tax=Brachybacterium timonense TaxID=2050896 RepID=UPI003CCC3767
MTSAIVVGSGPNGLSAALTLARSGIEVTVLEAAAQPGGGARSAEATLPGLLHDECSGFHPLQPPSFFFSQPASCGGAPSPVPAKHSVDPSISTDDKHPL